MASAAPSSPIEAGVKVRRGGKRIPTCKWDDPCPKPMRCDATKTMGRLADGDVPWPKFPGITHTPSLSPT
ncbi:hypothetical protein KEM48_009025 [Puccinia striiformis f. sp. tritici PST-130]|nr:hypothetical protein KEM48_009025 [Puccinia striiformis f. sp. tritici PST-130]